MGKTESDLVDPSFMDVRDELGVDLEGSTGWGVSWSDFDLDTDLDLLLVNGAIPVRDLETDAEPVLFFENRAAQGDAGYRDASDLVAGLIAVGRGAETADFDNDGDLDVAVNTIGGPLLLLENTGTEGTWLGVAVSPAQPGTTVTVELPDGRELVREIAAGGSYLLTKRPAGRVRAQVALHEQELARHGKAYEFHMYPGAGHGFFYYDRPAYRQQQAVDGWQKVFAFLQRHLGGPTRSA